MPDKRKGTMTPPSPKRPRISHENQSEQPSESYEQPRQNFIFGQRNAFPGLDDGGDELFYGPADDGLEYLRMVR
jgi:regulator of vacuolar morphogenesis